MTTAAPRMREMQHLLEALAVGAEAPFYSADAWAARLGDGHLERDFLAHLRQEWQPAAPPDALCAEVMAEARAHIAAWHPGWPHLWAHVLRVTGNLLLVAAETGIDPVHAFLLGMLHDIGKLDEQRSGVQHELIGALMTRKLLHGRDTCCSPELIERLAAAITKRSATGDPFGHLLYDADKLDKIGATGIARRISTGRDQAHIAFALQIVALDAKDFPQMHFDASQRLADLKRQYTAEFLALAQGPAESGSSSARSNRG